MSIKAKINGNWIDIYSSSDGPPPSDKLIYTELYKIKNYRANTFYIEKYINIKCCNLTPNKSYQIQLFTRSSVPNRTTRWIHPANDRYAHSNNPAIGYYQIAGKTMNYSSDDRMTYPAVPSWMPNEGVLQTEWNFVADESGEYILNLDLSKFLLPLLKYNIRDNAWCTNYNNSYKYPICNFIGTKEKRSGVLPTRIDGFIVDSAKVDGTDSVVFSKTPFRSFQFRIKDVDTGYVSPICDTLKVGKPYMKDSTDVILGLKYINIS